MEESKNTTCLHDYLWFLQNMDKFDDFSVNRKFKYQAKYVAYLKNLEEYLEGFMKRSRPLFNIEEFMNMKESFEGKYAQGKLIGWDHQNEGVD